jgi:outer membrane protein OmpA-like peptidoglycan-associated protein
MGRWGVLVAVALLIGLTGCSNKNLGYNTGLELGPGENLQPVAAESNLTTPQVVTEEMPAPKSATITEEKLPLPERKKRVARQLHNIVIYFDFDSYTIRPDQFPKIVEMAKIIKANSNLNFLVRI